MNNVRVLAFLSALCLSAAACTEAGQEDIRDLREAKRIFWTELYPGGFTELYCGVPVARRDGHNIEHIFAAKWMTDALRCGSRRMCRQQARAFNQMEADLHNLYPTRVAVNAARGNSPFGVVPGENQRFAQCDFEASADVVEPRPPARGDIARAVLYISETYDAAAGVPWGQLKLMRAWDRTDPPDAAERARNNRIEALQGTRNPFIDAHFN